MTTMCLVLVMIINIQNPMKIIFRLLIFCIKIFILYYKTSIFYDYNVPCFGDDNQYYKSHDFF